MGKQGVSFLGNVGVHLGQFFWEEWGHMGHLGEGEKCIDNGFPACLLPQQQKISEFTFPLFSHELHPQSHDSHQVSWILLLNGAKESLWCSTTSLFLKTEKCYRNKKV